MHLLIMVRILQTIATRKIIENLGLECEIINYIPFFEKKYKIALTQLKTKNNLNNPIKRIFLFTC